MEIDCKIRVSTIRNLAWKNQANAGKQCAAHLQKEAGKRLDVKPEALQADGNGNNKKGEILFFIIWFWRSRPRDRIAQVTERSRKVAYIYLDIAYILPIYI